MYRRELGCEDSGLVELAEGYILWWAVVVLDLATLYLVYCRLTYIVMFFFVHLTII